MVEPVPPLVDPPPKDRGRWLVLFGVVEILIGALCALFGAGTMFALVFADRLPSSGNASVGRAPLGVMVLFYGLCAMFFIAVGIGTMRGRRWARLAMLAASWFWLACGLLGSAMMAFILPAVMRTAVKDGGDPTRPVVGIVMGLIAAVMMVIYLLLPGAFLVFYTRRSVKATFERRDLRRTSALRCPLPVLALSIWLAFGAAMSLFGVAVRLQWFFGAMLTGLSAAMAALVLGGVHAWLARGVYRLRKGAWWGTLALYLMLGISGAVTFTRVPLSRIYERVAGEMGTQPLSGPVLQAIQAWIPLSSAVVQAMILGFVLYLGRYFRPRPIPPAQGPAI